MQKSKIPDKQALTVDVEDYFHVSAFEKAIAKSDWQNLEMRVERNTYRLLELFEQKQAKCTFFTLGWVAERCPNLIKAIVEQGHELASHGFDHQRATRMTPDEFRADVSKSKQVLEDISGQAVIGYRAPSFSFNDSNTWVYEILVELGFDYSSSTYPIEHDLYGVPNWPRFKYQRPEGIIEIPVPTVRKNNRNTGIGGGGYFRLYPYFLSKRRIDSYLSTEQQPYSFYFHPWEIDPDQPRVAGASIKSKLRHYLNLSTMEAKVVRLLEDYQWHTMKSVYLDGDIK
ncbi:MULTISPECIES: XrtA system polysaccharide deacetylase [Colwellia]|uniref:Polysaccharide deacetylase n=1 Tax=Colwellia marinimaniae TaxID=1513592 RepID=A0ABQ0MT12_9GAMM|nr:MULTISPECIES: XrtA system polysaccharide deacetylase [Colwellia]GAW95518.1 polysaccharide deacetylase [Colwellia marinimaniae]